MDCKNARLLFEFIRPGHEELAPDEAAVLKQHVQHCADCQETIRIEHRLDEALGRAMLSVPVPEGLRMRLLGRLQQERDRGYRRIFWGVTSAAAALLLVGALAWYSLDKLPDRAVVNLARLQSDTAERKEASLERVNAWLQQVSANQHLEAPAKFDYTLLEDYELTDLQGRLVPTLYFRDREGKAFARVYVLSDKQFALAAIQEQNKANVFLKSGAVKVDVLRESPDSPIVYVVVYTGNTLRPFLQKEQGPNV